MRDPDGEFLVLEDNLRTPSGFAYAVAARAALDSAAAAGLPARRARSTRSPTSCCAARSRAAAPAGRAHPSVVVLSDGPESSAHYEHAQAAARLGARSSTVERPRARRATARACAPGRIARSRVDVVYRRTDDDRLRGDDGELTAVAALLLEPWLSGRIGLVNAFGNGLADDKFVHGYVEDCIRFYLGEEPLVRSVPTHDRRRAGTGPRGDRTSFARSSSSRAAARAARAS